jgi:hypothetical protein
VNEVCESCNTHISLQLGFKDTQIVSNYFLFLVCYFLFLVSSIFGVLAIDLGAKSFSPLQLGTFLPLPHDALCAISVRLLVRVNVVGAARVAGSLVIKRGCINSVVLIWVADYDKVAAGSEAVFTVNLFLASTGGGRAGPDINVAFA